MSVIVNLNEGAPCPICERGRLVTVGTNVWNCSRPSCNNQYYFADEGEGKCSLAVRDRWPRSEEALPFIPQVSRPWNPAYRETWKAMTPRERQISFLIDLAIIAIVLIPLWWIA